MGEKEKFNVQKLSYEGIFKYKEIINLINDFGSDKSYEFVEVSHTESVKKTGKNVFLELGLKKRLSDYAKLNIKIKIEFINLSEKIVDKKKYQVGKVIFEFEGLMETDYEKKWESKPSFWLIRHLFEKYVFDSHLSILKKEAISDIDHLVKNLKAYFNMLT